MNYSLRDYLTLIILGGRGRPNHHSLSENSDFTRTKPPLGSRPVCKFEFVCCGPGEKTQSTLSFSVEAWPIDEVREHLFPNSKIEILTIINDFTQIFQKFSGDEFKS